MGSRKSRSILIFFAEFCDRIDRNWCPTIRRAMCIPHPKTHLPCAGLLYINIKGNLDFGCGDSRTTKARSRKMQSVYTSGGPRIGETARPMLPFADTSRPLTGARPSSPSDSTLGTATRPWSHPRSPELHTRQWDPASNPTANPP